MSADTSAPAPVTGEETSTAGSNDALAGRNGEKSRTFEVSVSQPAALSIAGAQQYVQVLERYLDALLLQGSLPQALAVLRRELDRNPTILCSMSGWRAFCNRTT